MKITGLKVNHVVNPMGYDLSTQTFSWKYDAGAAQIFEFTVSRGADGSYGADVDDEDGARKLRKVFGDSASLDISGEGQVTLAFDMAEAAGIAKARVQVASDADFINLIHDSGFSKEVSHVGYGTTLTLNARTRYYWRVQAQTIEGAHMISTTATFETGKLNEPWTARWLAIPDLDGGSPIVRKTFTVDRPVKRVVGYMCGLGLYECYMNGKLMNDGYLQPGYHNYNTWLQYQTFDMTDAVTVGENVMAFLLGAGWYKGRFGISGGTVNTYGENYQLLCEIHVTYTDGTEAVIGSDESFLNSTGPVLMSNIYDGEIYDATKEPAGWMLPGYVSVEADDRMCEAVAVAMDTHLPGAAPATAQPLWRPTTCAAPERYEKLSERLSVPVINKETMAPVGIFRTPSGKYILDMGQNMTGWLTFKDTLSAGSRVTLRHVELLRDGEPCRDNLTDALQTFEYISAGDGRLVRPHFTYFGFRYVVLEGFPENVSAGDFSGWNLYSDLETVGALTTGHEGVNQFIRNARWSQRDNFLDHPTDCPQRAERLGWTGDAQMYCPTACYTMDCASFYRKYMRDVNEEQDHHDGIVSFIVPRADRPRPAEEVREISDMSSAAWSDVATIIPWILYRFYGDKNMLSEQYAGMKAWVDSIRRKDMADGGKQLWQTGFHFGDWLALDNPEPGPFGLTDKFYIASCYYFYSTKLLARAAAVLEIEADRRTYGVFAEEIRQAIVDEYFDEHGLCRIHTQTAYVLAIYMDIISGAALMENGRLLADQIRNNGCHLDTGFVGTPYLCPALTKAGQNALAVELLLKEDFPSWLYQVKRGATTVWESWGALDEILKGTNGPSLNHYAFGSIVEWLYSDVCGIRPGTCGWGEGFKCLTMTPHPDARLGFARACVDTQAGKVALKWRCMPNGTVQYRIEC